jgi:hypothetical protein
MVHIVGLDRYPPLKVFEQVAPALVGLGEVYLGAQAACFMGLDLCGKVVYNMEPLYPGCRPFSVGYLELLRKNTVLDYSLSNVSFLISRGVRAFHLPYRFHPSLKRWEGSEKDIDVLFVGSGGTRREKVLNRLARRLGVEWVQGVYGLELDRLCRRARVHLNIHFADSYQLEVVRLNYLLANNETIVSEPGNESWVNDLYDPYLYMTSNLDGAIDIALENPKGRNDLMEKLPMDCSKAMEWLVGLN